MPSTDRMVFKVALALWTSCFVPQLYADGQWLEWGGAGRDFGSSQGGDGPAARLAVKAPEWGDLGPRLLWMQPLGPGYSGIVTDGQRLYTMTRAGADEVMLALSPEDGAELWRHTYPAPTSGLQWVDKSYGDAPQATPMLAEGKVYGLGFTGIVTAVDAASGELRWSRDLQRKDGVGVPYFGHAASPMRVGDTVVVAAGGVHAFDLGTGEPRWQNRQLEASYASPILVDAPGGAQLVVAGAGEIVGLDPASGRLLWRHEHSNQHRTILSSPVAGPGGRVFVSAYFLGSIGLRLGGGGKVSEIWEREDVQVSQSNAVRVGEMVVASHNRNLVAVDLGSGEVLWKEKGLGRSNLVHQGAQTLLLDDRGRLSVAALDRAGFRRLASSQILEGRSWTAPTVVGDRLYARNGTSVVGVHWNAAARNRGETLAGLRQEVAESRPVAPLPTSAPAELLAARDRALAAMHAGDPDRLRAADAALKPWSEHPELGIYGLYYRGLVAWQLSGIRDSDDPLRWVDRSVELLSAAVEKREDFAEAHALLGTIYPSYYRLDRARAGSLGPLGDEHLIRAVELEPDNPRILAIQGLDFVYSPPRYGGDPDRGLEILGRAIERADGESRTESDPRPGWGRGMIRLWTAQILASNGDTSRARSLLEEAMQIAPDLAGARTLLQQLASDGDAAQGSDSKTRSKSSR